MYNPDLSGKKKNEQNVAEGNATEDNKPFFVVEEADKFPKTRDIAYVSSSEILGEINDLVSAAYEDYHGSKMEVTPAGVIVKLYFTATKQFNEDSVRAFRTLSEIPAEKSTSTNRLIRDAGIIKERKLGNVYKITDEGKRGLKELLPNNLLNKKGEPNWDVVVTEETEPIPGNAFGMAQRYTTYAVVKFIDIYKILRLCYGAKTEEGAWAQYQFSPIRPLSQTQYQQPTFMYGPTGEVVMAQNTPYSAPANTEWLILLERLDMNALNELNRKCGNYITTGSLGIYTSR